MSEAAAAAAATPAAPAAAPPQAPPSAGAALSSVPTGPDWASGFKEDVRPAVARFKTPEDLAVAYQNLEKLKGVPEDRLLKLPEKMEGDEAKAVWQKLGAPKEAKEYALPRDEKAPDPKFVDWAETAFYKNNLTKAQAVGVVQEFNDYVKSQGQAQMEARKQALAQGELDLQKEWGQHYDTNLNLAKQGAKILGLDAKTLDVIEAVQGRASLFKTLQKIGVGVGESKFVDGGPAPAAMTQEQAQQELSKLKQDQKFGKKVLRGDAEATAKWNELNRLAAPGEKQIG